MVDAEVQAGPDDGQRRRRAPTTLPIRRGRPGTTSMYMTPTTVVDTIAAVADGSEKPCQRPMVVTSYGRARRNAAISRTPTSCSTTTPPRNVKR